MILSDTTQSLNFTGLYIDCLEDPTSNLEFKDVLSGKFKFKKGSKGEITNNANSSSTYWTKITLINNSTLPRNWLVELYDYKIEYYEIYLPDNKGGYSKFVNGSTFNFKSKDYQHKNFIHDLYDLSGGPKTIYFKFKSERRVVFIGVVRTVQRMLEYSNMEYFLLSLFYGIVIAMIIYNSFLFMATLDIAYFFYVLYVASIGILALTKDGIGFQILWYNYPKLNDIVPVVSNFFTIFWALMYARSFLNTPTHMPQLDKGILAILFIRTIFFALSFYYPDVAFNTWLDLLPLFYIYFLGIISWYNGYRMARYYILAYTIFFIGYSLAVLNDYHVISSHPLIIYGFNIGILCEMLLLSMALADRIKILTYEKETAQKQIIIQSKETEELKDKINRELESKVYARTVALEEKNKELDTFVYRSSHDIKGPVKSIIGLTTIGLQDVKDETARNYFQHILKSSQRLDSVVNHLLQVMEAKDYKLNITTINFENLITGLLKTMKDMPMYSTVKSELKINNDIEFNSDSQLLTSVLQSLIENCYKYSDPNKTLSYIKINVKVNEKEAFIEIIDNGLGIEKRLQEKIFDMLYKINPESSDSGLGLYMSKIYAEKLGGSLRLFSEEGDGTKYTINLKNYEY